MLQKIASSWLTNLIDKIDKSNEIRNNKEWLAEYKNPRRLEQINRVPEHAMIDEQGIWHADSILNEPTNKNLTNYQYKQIVKKIQQKLLPEFYNNTKDWLSLYPEVKSLKLKGIERILDEKKTPLLYRLTVGSPDDKYFDATEALDHDIIVDPAMTSIDIEG